jgi:hypothetical protein
MTPRTVRPWELLTLCLALGAGGCSSTTAPQGPGGASGATSPRAATAPSTGAVPAAPASDDSENVIVWANPATMVYHCRGTGGFKVGEKGQLLKQAAAKADHYLPAYGRECPSVPVAADAALGSSTKDRSKGKGCGVERWPVKTLVDDDAGDVIRTPVEASVLDLVSIPRPPTQPPQARRLKPTEFTVFRVHANLTLVKKEKDQDFHLVLSDPDDPETTMIAEVPFKTCASGSGEEANFEKLQKLLEPYKGNHEDDPIEVEVEGVGFFDFLHNQTGVAPNGLELHPVLALKILNKEAPK